MDFSLRTVLRHFGIAGLMIATLVVAFRDQGVILPWLRTNAIFLGVWLLLVMGLGWFADAAVRWEWFDRLPGLKADSKAKGGRSRFRELFKKWSGCSRCVGYWSGGLFSFAAAALYFPRWFPGSLFFMFLGASLATGIAVSAYLWRTWPGPNQEEL